MGAAFYSFLFLVAATNAEVIGSSVVTSVSVILGDEPKPSDPLTSTFTRSRKDDPAPPSSSGGGVQNVIEALKTIVQEEQEKQAQTSTLARSPVTSASSPAPTTTPPAPAPETASVSASQQFGGDDDDEMESSGGSSGGIGFVAPTTDAINDFAMHVVNMTPEVEEQEQENDTATSAEVHDAIHKISGAILSYDDADGAEGSVKKNRTNKPIEHIVNDVLSSINSSKSTLNKPSPTKATPTTKRPKPTTKPTTKKPKPPTTTTTKRPSTTSTTAATESKLKTELSMATRHPPRNKPPKIHLPSIIMLDEEPTQGQGHAQGHQGFNSNNKMDKKQGQYEHEKIPGLPVDDPFDGEDEGGNRWQLAPGRPLTEPVRTYAPPPTKSPHKHKTQPSQSGAPNKPNEFYDDEIFGYDPYQTFFHGVYVPVMQVGTLSEVLPPADEESSEEVAPPPTPRPKPKRKPPKSNSSKLPDHLHRPRPSHLQYQHGAADDTDLETGMLNVHYEHPGMVDVPDKLNLVPPPKLAPSVRKNFTEFHDAHVAHQHGVGHGHGHGHGHLGHDPSEKRPVFGPGPKGNPGLDATLTSLDEEKRLFVDINNRLALRLLGALSNPASHSSTAGGSYENMVISPFTISSSLGLLFLGSRGHTAAQLDSLLQMDDMLTFNPHMLYHNVTESFLSQPNTAAAIIRLLITDKEKGDVLEFYKTRVQHFYEARVEEVDYKFAGHLAQSIINQMIRAQIQRHSYEMLNYSLPLGGPMSLITAAFFDGQFAGPRDPTVSTMNFIHLAAAGQGQSHSARRLFEVPAFALRGHFRSVYDADLDATGVEVPYTTRDLSLILLLPGKPGEFAFGGVTALKSRLTFDAWTRLMRGFYSRDFSYKLIVPRFRIQTTSNISHTLERFGLTDMFEPTLAKFKGVNGLLDLYLDKNMAHFAEFGTWEKLSDTMSEGNRKLDLIRILRPNVKGHYGGQRSAPADDVSRLRNELEALRLRSTSTAARPRAAQRYSTQHKKYYRQEGEREGTEEGEEAVLRFERPFLYFLRHNPTGSILFSGQYTTPITEIVD